MKKILVLGLIVIVLSILVGCQSDASDTSIDATADTSVTDVTEPQASYTVEMVEFSDGKIVIEYPQLKGQGEVYTSINSSIYSEVENWFKDEAADDVSVDVKYSVTLSNETYFCVLFEGGYYALNAAYPTRVVKAICFSMADGNVIDPTSVTEIDEDFVEKFKIELDNSSDTERFTDEQWASVVSYFNAFSNEELTEKIINGEAALTENGILVCVEVPHAIGDYIKVSVNNK
ncbi:MAG: hypothetical protein E7615_02575 [Ruminococcaceae bacterium]|nr:hypothetical protein [Oscillospiraceae bacterium]